MRSPFNWVGNKFKHMEKVNAIIKGKDYNAVYDVFMGSGNILVNLDCKADSFVGNDLTPLLPNIYKEIKGQFTLEELELIIKKWNNFSDKKDYYSFRDYWNVKYLGNNYDREFIYETILLLKMCSNSMVRFNRKEGYFNQGFRGLAKGKQEFFTDTAKNNIVKALNNFSSHLSTKSLEFKTKDFKEVLSLAGKDDLIILDPPYLLSTSMYGADFTEKQDNYIYEFLEQTKADFILFNYLENGNNVNLGLQKFIKDNNVNVKVISESDSAGQGKLKGSKSIKEVMVYRVSKDS